MAKHETATIPTVDEAQSLMTRAGAIEMELKKLEADVERHSENLKVCKELYKTKIAELRGIAGATQEEHPLLDGEEGDDGSNTS